MFRGGGPFGPVSATPGAAGDKLVESRSTLDTTKGEDAEPGEQATFQDSLAVGGAGAIPSTCGADHHVSVFPCVAIPCPGPETGQTRMYCSKRSAITP